MKRAELRIATLLLLGVLGLSEGFLAHTVLYTEGEVTQILYKGLLWLNLPLLAAAFWRPRWSLWGGLALAALLLPWQTSENRKWACINEEVLTIIQFVEAEQEVSGDYPTTLTDYTFRRDWVANHVSYGPEGDIYRLTYFMDDDSISYWFDSKSGFGYYPD